MTGNVKSNIIKKSSFEAENNENNVHETVWGQLVVIRRLHKKFDLSKLEYAVGRENCDINLTTDEMSVEHLQFISRTHFKLKRDSWNSPVYLEDFSRNGTFINGEKVGKGNQRILQNEDVIAIGSDFRKLFRFFDRFTHTVDKIPKLIKDDYYISRELGSGACGVVRLIFNKRTCDKFAMKQIIKSKADDEKKLNHPNRIMNEINIMKKLDHPFIVSVYNIVETPEAVFLILELMNGGDLYNKIKESKYLKEPIVKNIIYQLAVAVNYLHRQNITHRDLKPENILLQSNSDDSIVKLSDFGLSKIVEGNTVLQTECGTAWYVAPEVILKNYKTYTEKVDVWSLGVILYVCLCGCLPFSAADQICKGKYSFKQSIWSSVSAECKDLISKMLQVDPKTRYSSSEVLNHKWLQDPDVIKRYNDLLNQENEKQEITVSDLEDSINEHYNNSCPENCLDIIEPPAKRHRSLLIF